MASRASSTGSRSSLRTSQAGSGAQCQIKAATGRQAGRQQPAAGPLLHRCKQAAAHLAEGGADSLQFGAGTDVQQHGRCQGRYSGAPGAIDMLPQRNR